MFSVFLPDISNLMGIILDKALLLLNLFRISKLFIASRMCLVIFYDSIWYILCLSFGLERWWDVKAGFTLF